MSNLFVQMALDCIEFAYASRNINDYNDYCKRQLGAGTAYYDRIRVKDQLIDEGFIRLDDNKLRLGEAHSSEWLEQALVNGEQAAWAICDCFPRRKLKFDPDDLAKRELGLAGELHVIDRLKQLLPASDHHRISHVSLIDDSAGYDIRSPTLSGHETESLLEVKTSARSGSNFTLFMSRNEVETGLRNPNWHLVLVLAKSGDFEITGVLKMSAIADLLPQDMSEEASWISLKLVLPVEGLHSQLP
jgi:hypothetical protein